MLSGLPVAGFDGTLDGGSAPTPTAPAAGQVRAKTGTLDGVSALAGLLRTGDGRLLAFDVTLDAVPSGGDRGGRGRAGPGRRGAGRLRLPLSSDRSDRAPGTYRRVMPSPVDYGLAVATARRLAPAGPVLSLTQAADVVGELRRSPCRPRSTSGR